MRSSVLFLVTVLLISSVGYSQKGNLTGFVKDASNGDPLVGANVFIVGTSLGTAANEEGFYKLSDLNEGMYLLRAEYIGYVMMEDSVVITVDSDVNLDFMLNYTTIEGEEVTVTAQAKGQMDAINKQLNSSSIVNIVSADRIQELPDANAAESVARVPGVSIKREGGEGNKVVIRGLSPKYNSITVDGTRLASTDPDDRSTDLSMISQYMLDGIEVTKAGTPDLDADVLGGTVNFILKKAKPGLHANVITQGMYNGLEETYNDNKFVFDVSNRFWKDRIGILAQIDRENRNRSSHELNASYTLPGAELDSVNELFFTGLGLYDVLRKNKRNNNTVMIDVNIPNGNISYSSLNSSIDKDIINYSTNYAFSSNARRSSSGKTDSKIEVTTRTLRYKQTLFSNLHIDAFSSFSKSTNTSYAYSFNFLEPDAYTESTFGIKMERVEQIAKFDTLNTGLDSYQYNKFFSDEVEETYGVNIALDFRLGKQISGKLKFGNKVRTKEREFDRNNEYAPVAAAAGLRGPRDSLVLHFPQLFENQGLDPRRIPITGFMNHDYDPGNFMNGESVRVYSDNGATPDGLESEQIYYVSNITDGTTCRLSKSFNAALAGSDNDVIDIKNSNGGILSIVSRVTDKVPGDLGHPIQYDNTEKQWYAIGAASTITNTIYYGFTQQQAEIAANNSSTYVQRKSENRDLNDRIYKLRYVIPKDYTNPIAKAPSKNYVLQESSSTGFNLAKEIENDGININRNPRIIAGITTANLVATVVSETPHKLSEGDRVLITQVTSSENTTGVGNSGYNGYYYVESVPSTKSFTYNIPKPAGTFTNDLKVRNNTTTLPLFSRNEYSTT